MISLLLQINSHNQTVEKHVNLIAEFQKAFDDINKLVWVSRHLYRIRSTLTAIILLHYRVAAKMALEILGYAMWAGGGGAIFLGNPR